MGMPASAWGSLGLRFHEKYSRGYPLGFGPSMEYVKPKLYQGDTVLWRTPKPIETQILHLPLCITTGSGRGCKMFPAGSCI